MRLGVITFSEQGLCTGERIRAAREANGDQAALSRCASGELAAWTAAHFSADDALIFVGSCGIAVRAVAPFLRSKAEDPAIVVVDEGASFVISLLSGHIGGANALASALAEDLGALPVVTTATDVRGLTAIDAWAAEKGLSVADPTRIKAISARMLAGEPARLKSEFPTAGKPPKGIVLCEGVPDARVTCRAFDVDGALRLIPRIVTFGVGCRRGIGADEIERAFRQILERADCHPLAVREVCSIDLKAEEPGLLAFCRRHGLSLHTFSPEALSAVPGTYAGSAFVRSVTGVDSVCERSAVLGSGGRLLAGKQAENGVTAALAIADYTVCFEEETTHE